MTSYVQCSNEQLNTIYVEVEKDYKRLQGLGLNLDMSRGKPSAKQLDLSAPMLSILKTSNDCILDDGTDCRNYGILDGIPEAKSMMSYLLDDQPQNTIVLGNSSLTAMYDTIARCLNFGCLGSKPWASFDSISFICPVPGYDRHFAILEEFGINMICVDMTESGPDMDAVESIVSADESVKGIWCVPKYSNPTGITYSDETVQRLASMKCAADDFRIFWDNAYCVHNLYPETSKQDTLLDISRPCIEAGNENRYFKFSSTSKITFPGAGICAFASSPANVQEAKLHLSKQMIGGDKLAQLRHIKFIPNEKALSEHMNKLAEVIRPKFELVDNKLSSSLSRLGIANWTNPRGGYFVSFDGLIGTARRTVELAKDAGVILTSAGATYPIGQDFNDSNIRIAPTMPTLEELDIALDVFTCCVKLAAIEVLLK